MNFLRAFGAAVVKGLQIVAALEGINIPGVHVDTGPLQKIESGLHKLLGIIMDVEAMGQAANLSGDQMLLAEAALGQQVLLDVLKALNTKFQVQDEALLKEGVAETMNGLVKVLKSGHPDAVQTTDVKA